jgi:hypothetical protein
MCSRRSAPGCTAAGRLGTERCALSRLPRPGADPTVADAILDRLVHYAHKLSLKGESMRKVLGAAKSNQGKQEEKLRRR